MRVSPRARAARAVLLAVAVGGSAACHHVIIDGGLEPTQQRHDEEWNLAFAMAIFPAKVDARTYCDGYFSQVETRHSFLNLVVTGFTLGVISPMESRIQCGAPSAAGGGGASAPASPADRDRASAPGEVPHVR